MKHTIKHISISAKSLFSLILLFGLLFASSQAFAAISRDYISVFQKRAKAAKSKSASQLQKNLQKDIARLASLFSASAAAKAALPKAESKKQKGKALALTAKKTRRKKQIAKNKSSSSFNNIRFSQKRIQ